MNDLMDLAMRKRGVQSRAITPENPTGEKGMGGRAKQGMGADCAGAMGVGWKIAPSIEIGVGETATLAVIDGSGVVQSIWFGGVVCREYILKFYWEEEEIPAVVCPLPDFFACGWLRGTFENWNSGPFETLASAAVTVAPNKGLNCFWAMPFRKKCRIMVTNNSRRPYVCYYQINYCLCEVAADAAYFHAQYHASVPVVAGEVHTILDGVQGGGHYVGTALSVGLNGDDRWWGEGEVKFYLDGDDVFPTICGTGTEDYFGGSFNWEVEGKYVTYTAPYLGMHYYAKPNGLYDIQPRFSMYRWHIADPIYFEQDIRVTIQDLGWQEFDEGRHYLQRRDDIHSVAYWYQTGK